MSALTAVPAATSVASDPQVAKIADELRKLRVEHAEARARLDAVLAAQVVAQGTRGAAAQLHDLAIDEGEARAALADVDARLADASRRDQLARKAAAQVVQQREGIRLDEQLTALDGQLLRAVEPVVRVAGAHHRALERRAAHEVQVTGSAEAARQLIATRNAASVVQALEVVAEWMARQPGQQPPSRDAFIDPVTGRSINTSPVGRLVARYFDLFFTE